MNRQATSQLSALITGYSPIELEGTGLIDAYARLFEQIVGPRFAERLALLVSDVTTQETSLDEWRGDS